MRDSQIHGFAVSLSKVITHLTHVDSHKGAPPCRAAMPANLRKVAGTQDTHPAAMQPADVDNPASICEQAITKVSKTQTTTQTTTCDAVS